MKRIFLVLVLLPVSIFAQIGGSSTYEFVTLPYSAAENAFGGNVITRTETNLPFALKNPSLLDSSYNNEIVGNWGMIHLKETGIGLGTIGYAHALSHGLTLQGGIHFLNYGVFEGYDESGNPINNFVPSEYEIISGVSYQLKDNIFVGANLKPILSYLESYTSYGLLFDAGISYRLERSCFSIAARNVGWSLKPYTKGNREAVPYSIDLGMTQKLEHAPIRFNFTYEDLQHFDISEPKAKKTSSNNSIYEENEEREFVTFGKKFIKHFTVSTEIFLGKHITVIGGYNYRKSEELSFGSSKQGAGISAGFILTFSRFNISYGWAKQQVAGGRNFFTLGLNAETIYSAYQTQAQKRKSTNL
ncbi:MAG: type IX secretion system protein PorQ [Bacteroidales bacterium]|nr:type IX secretion system protein PorQ [Bacteroidales bacterium]